MSSFSDKIAQRLISPSSIDEQVKVTKKDKELDGSLEEISCY